MAKRRRQQRLDVVGRDELVAVECSVGARAEHQQNLSSRAGTQRDLRRGPGGRRQVDHVAADLLVKHDP